MLPVASTSQLAAAYTTRVASMQNNVMKEAGDQAVKLIQSAAVLPQTQGQHLDVRI